MLNDITLTVLPYHHKLFNLYDSYIDGKQLTTSQGTPDL